MFNIKSINVLWIILLVVNLSVSTQAIVLNPKENNDAVKLLNNIENTLYLSGFEKSDILIAEYYDYNNMKNENYYISNGDLQKIIFNKFNFYNSNNYKNKTVGFINKKEIFYVRSLNNTEFYENLKNIYNDEIKIHTILENNQKFNLLGAVIKYNDETYSYNTVDFNSEKNIITISTETGPTINYSIHNLLNNKSVYEQLEKSALDLKKTKIMMTLDFAKYITGWGLLFYDDKNEYFLPFNSNTFYMEYKETDYLTASELKTMDFQSLKLYDVRKEIIPFIITEQKMADLALERAEKDNYKKIPTNEWWKTSDN